MKRFLTLLVASFSAGAMVAQAPVSNPVVEIPETPAYGVIINPGSYVADQLLVMLRAGSSIGEVEKDLAAKGFVIREYRETSKTMRVWTLTFVSGTNILNALEISKAIPGIQLAQLNHYIASRATTPNDAQFGNMWGLDNTGQNGGTPDADIDAPEAWDITTGGLTTQGDTIVVAVIDAGFDLNQPDLNFLKNYGEIPGNNIDDDGNGYIDDFNGWNAYNSNGTITSDQHGTHVSGTVGAKGNNTIGVAGVNWGVKILPVMGSTGTESIAVEAYTYVLDARRLYNQTNGAQGAFVVSTNSSFGVDQGQPASYPIWCAMYDSMGVEGILSAAATANQNWNIDNVGDIPTACASDFMIAVTNTNRNDLKSTNAGYGATTIDLGAPGTSIYSTLPGSSYGQLSGTSMATPHVAGAVALMYAAACPQLITDYKNSPDSVALIMRCYLLANVDPLANLNGQCTSGGRLNLYNALVAVQQYNCGPLVVEETATAGIQTVFPNPASGIVQVNFKQESAGEVSFVITNMLGQTVFSSTQSAVAGINSALIDISTLSPGVYFIQAVSGGVNSPAMQLIVQ
jgi:serine protease